METYTRPRRLRFAIKLITGTTIGPRNVSWAGPEALQSLVVA